MIFTCVQTSSTSRRRQGSRLCRSYFCCSGLKFRLAVHLSVVTYCASLWTCLFMAWHFLTLHTVNWLLRYHYTAKPGTHSYKLTTWSTEKKITVNLLFDNSLFFYGNQSFITVITKPTAGPLPRLVSTSPRSRVSSGSIVSNYGLDDWAIGVRSPAGTKDFYYNICVQNGSGVHPASCTMGTGVLSPGVKARPGRDADHSPPSSAEVENE
jgi:hypothetical protein